MSALHATDMYYVCKCGYIGRATNFCEHCALSRKGYSVLTPASVINRYSYASFCSRGCPVSVLLSSLTEGYCGYCKTARTVRPLITGDMGKMNHDHDYCQTTNEPCTCLPPISNTERVYKVSATFKDGSVSEASGDFNFAVMNLDYLRQNLPNLTHISFEDVSDDQRSTV